MISNVKDYPVSSYFNPDEKQRFFIPKYQREYVWKKEHWEALFNDLEDAPPGHFLGSIICINTQSDAFQGSQLELIDGQQRFTTICLLFCALYRKLKSVPNPDEDLLLELANLKNRLFIKSAKEWRFLPSEQAQNKADYQKVLNELFPDLVSAPKGLAYFGNRRIAKTWWYFCDRLEPFDAPQTLDFLEKLKSAVLVKIEVPSHADAFVLFETINNRGIPLSAIDIIKNNLLAQLDRIPEFGIDRAFDEWKELVDLLPDPTIQERFLRQLYNAFKYLKPVQVRGCPRATRSNLITIYDTLLRKRPVRLFSALQDQGKIYAALIDPERAALQWDADTAHALRDLNHLGAAPAYAFLLWSNRVAQDQGWDVASTLTALASFLTRWFFWRNLTDTPPTRELDAMFMDMIDTLLIPLRARQMKDHWAFAKEVADLLNKRAAAEDVRNAKLAGDIYQENYEVTRFLLCKLEESHQTRETRRDLWAADVHGKPVFTVEHILPKTENLSPAWNDMLADGDAAAAADIRDRWAHRLGNLTLSGYNSALGKMDFLRKRDRKNDKGDHIGYRNGLYLNQELAMRDDWTESAMEERTTRLTREVLGLFDLEDRP